MKGLSLDSRSGIWQMDRVVEIPSQLAFYPHVYKTRIRGSTYETYYEVAAELLTRVIINTKRELEEGPPRKSFTVDDGIKEYWKTRKSAHQIKDAVFHTYVLSMFLGRVPLKLIHTNHPDVQRMIGHCQKVFENTAGTINKRLSVLSHILKMAHTEWWDEHNRVWVDAPGHIAKLEATSVKGYPLTGGQERELLKRLSPDLEDAALFAIHTGLRDKYIRGLRWDQEVVIRGLGSVFDISNKNGIPHRVVLNSIARGIIECKRGQHEEYVFTYPTRTRSEDGTFVSGGKDRTNYRSVLGNRRFKNAVREVGLADARGPGHSFRFHDLRHTFATRLKAMDVPTKTIKDLMGHSTGDVTAQYTSLETTNLLKASQLLVEWYDTGPTLWVRKSGQAA
jgi:integrase